jgi:hypothetical protein
MSGRGRRIAVVLAALALVLSAGRWGSVFVSDRLWEASVGEAVAVAGARRALLGLSLELLVLLISVAWFLVHFSVAARIALPERAPPERENAHLWPSQVPRWTLTIIAVVFGAVLGSGAGQWLDEVLLSLDGIKFGVPDLLLGTDLGVFLRDFPLWLDLQARGFLLIAVALAAVLLLHAAGGTIRIAARRLWVSPAARGQIAILLACFALIVAWSCVLEPFRLAAGLRGPILPSEFLLRTPLALLAAALGATAAVFSFLWWLRMRGFVAFVAWVLFGVALLAGRVLPLYSDTASADPGWQAPARNVDSVSFALAVGEGGTPLARAPAALLSATLWDESILSGAAVDSGSLVGQTRGWLSQGGRARPVWFAVREVRALRPALLALSDDQVSPSGGLLAWREGDSTPTPGVGSYRELSPHDLRPSAPAVEVGPEVRGVSLDAWPKRIMLAWALQAPAALSAPSQSRVGWRLDPLERLRAIAPFAHWSPPRARPSGSQLVWTSEGLLTSSLFPASTRIEWFGGTVSMVRPAFLGMVDAGTGAVRVFRRDMGDSLSAAWARIAAPLIEPASEIPAFLRVGEAYPEELLLAQARALEGPAWGAGRLERSPGVGKALLPPPSPGGGEVLVPFIHGTTKKVRVLLHSLRTPKGDSVRVIRLDSLHAIDSPSGFIQRWDRFPFQQQVRDSVRAAGATFESGQVRFELAAEGVVAYQPAWAVTPSGGAQLVLVNVALGSAIGAGRTFGEAWKNLRGEVTPSAAGAPAQALLEEARRWMRHADSALKRGDLQELGRALAYLRDLLERPRDKP